MIRHIVMWKFMENTEAQAAQFLDGLAALNGVIPEIRRMEIRRAAAENGYDAVLVADFDSLQAVETYKNDPRHLAVAALCKSIRTDRAAIDVEI